MIEEKSCENCESYVKHTMGYTIEEVGYTSEGFCHDGRVMKRTVRSCEAKDCDFYVDVLGEDVE